MSHGVSQGIGQGILLTWAKTWVLLTAARGGCAEGTDSSDALVLAHIMRMPWPMPWLASWAQAIDRQALYKR